MQQRLKGHRVEVTGTSREGAYGKCGFGLAPSLGIFTNCVRTARFDVFCYHLAEENVACSKECKPPHGLGISWVGSVYPVTTARFVADQLI